MRIALVCMPFSSAQYSSLALSLLKPILMQSGYSADVYYFNLRFAEMLTPPVYEDLCGDQAFNLGEQAFADVLYPERCSDKVVRKFLSDIVPERFYRSMVRHAHQLVEEAAQAILAGNYSVVGLTTTFYQKMASLAVAARLRERNYKAHIILGGAACESPMGEVILRNAPMVDAVFHGDAEASLPRYLNALRSNDVGALTRIPGVSLRTRDGCVHGAPPAEVPKVIRTPRPDYREYVSAIEKHGLSTSVEWHLSYETSRGCWWGEKSHCTFCGLNGSQMRHRVRPERDVTEELRSIRAEYGPGLVHFTDNILHYKFARTLLPALREISGQSYFAEVKSNLKPAEMVQMALAGMMRIQPGIERLNDRALRLMGKGTSALQNVQTIRLATELGMRCAWNMLLGFPGERAADVQREINLVKTLRHLPPPETCERIRLDRYSPNFTQHREKGFTNIRPSRAESMLFYGWDNISDVAYHFDYDLSPAPEPCLVDAWAELRRYVEDWTISPRLGSLVVYEEGDLLIVQDVRDGSGTETVLDGMPASLYRACMEMQAVSRLLAQFPNASPVLGALAEKGLLLVENGRALSLAVRDREMMKRVLQDELSGALAT